MRELVFDVTVDDEGNLLAVGCQVNQVGSHVQVASHVVLVAEVPRHHRIPVSQHNPLGIGIFKNILREVGET